MQRLQWEQRGGELESVGGSEANREHLKRSSVHFVQQVTRSGAGGRPDGVGVSSAFQSTGQSAPGTEGTLAGRLGGDSSPQPQAG